MLLKCRGGGGYIEANEFVIIYCIIDQIKERVRKAISRERLNDRKVSVVEVDLSGIFIPDYNHSDVLANIHEIFVAERIKERLFIKVIYLCYIIHFADYYWLWNPVRRGRQRKDSPKSRKWA